MKIDSLPVVDGGDDDDDATRSHLVQRAKKASVYILRLRIKFILRCVGSDRSS